MPAINKFAPKTAADAMKAVNTAANNANAHITLSSAVADKLEKKLETLAKNSPAQAYGLIVYLDELQKGGRLNFGSTPGGHFQRNAFIDLVDGAKQILLGNAMLTDDMQQDLLAR